MVLLGAPAEIPILTEEDCHNPALNKITIHLFEEQKQKRTDPKLLNGVVYSSMAFLLDLVSFASAIFR